MTQTKQNSSLMKVVPVMFCFFAMGFVDLVGVASNYVKADLNLSDSLANFLPSLVFVWFVLFSIPTGVLMNKIGRKKTVLLSLIVTLLALLLPLFGNTLPLMLIAFSLLGIGNAIMQTSLNPLVTCVMQGGNLASTLTFGQFIKAIASFIAPFIASWGAASVIPTFGYDWRILFAVFLVVGIIATLVLFSVQIEEPVADVKEEGVGTQFVNAFKLLGNPIVLLSFIGIACHVGIDVGTNTIAPKILQERLGLTLNDAAFATSVYFIGRTVGCFTGSFFLRMMKTQYFFIISTVLMAVAMVLMYTGSSMFLLLAGFAIVGYGNSNIFSMCFANALQAVPEKQNEVSGLMIMGLVGGTVFPFAMGLASDAMGGQAGAVLCMAVGVIYLFTYIPKLK